MLNRERAVDFLNQQERLYVVDGYACWDPAARYRIRVVCGRPSHALFAHNMLIRWVAGWLCECGLGLLASERQCWWQVAEQEASGQMALRQHRP